MGTALAVRGRRESSFERARQAAGYDEPPPDPAVIKIIDRATRRGIMCLPATSRQIMMTTALTRPRNCGRPPNPGHEPCLQSSRPTPPLGILSISTANDDHTAVRQSCSGMSCWIETAAVLPPYGLPTPESRPNLDCLLRAQPARWDLARYPRAAMAGRRKAASNRDLADGRRMALGGGAEPGRCTTFWRSR